MLQPHPTHDGVDNRELSPQRWDELKQEVARRARAARTQTMRELFRALAAASVATARRASRAYAIWRERQRAIRELGGLDDYALKDIGLHRSEIESVVYGLHRDPMPARRITVRRSHQPHDRPTERRAAATSAAPKRWTEKDAA